VSGYCCYVYTVMNGHDPTQRYLSSEVRQPATDVTIKNHPVKVKAITSELKKHDVYYLTQNHRQDQAGNNANSPYILLRAWAKEHRLGVGALKILKAKEATDEAAEAQIRRDELTAKRFISAYIPPHEFEEMGGYDAEVKDIWDKFLRYPFQGLDELEVQDKAREKLDTAVGDTKLLLSDYSKYLRDLQMLLTYNATMFGLDDNAN
jgi:hypothetical protein